jgi:hypothetical protein
MHLNLIAARSAGNMEHSEGAIVDDDMVNQAVIVAIAQSRMGDIVRPRTVTLLQHLHTCAAFP